MPRSSEARSIRISMAPSSAPSAVRTSVVFEELNRERRAYRLTWDLSTFGLSLQAGPKYAVGTTLPIALHLPDDQTGPISFTAEVVGTHPSTGGLRLAFRNPSGTAARRLHRFLFGSGAVAGA